MPLKREVERVVERRNRNILIALIAVVIVVAVFSSFGLPLFSGPTATITLPTPVPSGEENPTGVSQGGGTQVDVTPETVQSVIAAMSRVESYSRTVTTTLEGVVSTTRIWVDGGWSRSELSLSSGQVIHTIVGDGTVWRWYEGDRSAVSWALADGSADIEGQRLPTYEDVLELDAEEIVSAGYEERDGLSCVYVEVSVADLGQRERYWVAVDSGLLSAAETETEEGEVVWSMSSTPPEIPVSGEAAFTLPDGTVLHEVGE